MVEQLQQGDKTQNPLQAFQSNATELSAENVVDKYPADVRQMQ